MSVVPTIEQILSHDGVRLSIRDRGGSGPPVVLLHGLAGQRDEWNALATSLGHAYRLIEVDQRGHGDSERRPRDVSRAAYVADVAAVIEHLELESAILVGQSLGGHTAMLAAAAHPDLVRALVLIEAGAGGPAPALPDRIRTWLDGWPIPFASRAAAVTYFGGGPVGDGWAGCLEQRPDGWRPRFDPEIMVDSVAENARRSFWTEWENVRCPVLLVLAQSGFIAVEESCRMLERRPETVALSIPATGHDLHLERPDVLGRRIEGFLADLDRTGRVPGRLGPMRSSTPSDPDIEAIAEEYGLGAVDEFRRALSGTMNETYLVTVPGRTVVMRRHRRTERSAIEAEQQIMVHARERGIPVPEILSTARGESMVHRDGRWHSVLALARGSEVDRTELDATHARAMGAMLARLHTALADYPTEPVPPAVYDPASTLRRIADLQSLLVERSPRTEQEQNTLESLSGQATALRAAAPPAPSVRAVQAIHGDYQHTNLFFDAGTVTDVIDWDKACTGDPAAEIVRAMNLSLALDPALCQAFVDGYREQSPLSMPHLDTAAEIYGYETLLDLWVAEAWYLRGEERVREFLQAPPYLPLSERWARLRQTLT